MASASAGPPLVLLTGASGFFGSALLKELLTDGEYRVRATVRNVSDEKKTKPIEEMCPDAKYPVELVSADLTKDDGWQSAVEGCTYVLHTASPLPLNPSVEGRETVALMVDAPVEGMKRVLNACAEAGTVKRVVVTSSFYACFNKGKPGSDPLTEEDWSDEIMMKHLYCRGKCLAEKTAWDVVDKLPDDKKFELVTLQPGMMIGPNALKSANTTNKAVLQLLEREFPFVFKVTVPWIDLRDVVRAHILALTNEKAPGNRYLVCAGEYQNEELSRILREEFGPQGYNVPTRKGPNFLVKMAGVFDKTFAFARDSFLRPAKSFDSTKFKTDFNFEFRNFRETVIETTYHMIELGIATRKRQYRGPGGAAQKSTAKSLAADDDQAKPEAVTAEQHGGEGAKVQETDETN